MLESTFQAKFKKSLFKSYPGCFVLRLDPELNPPGTPDLLFLYKRFWAALEMKRQSSSRHQPNQDYYIEMMNASSYASFVSINNYKEVLNDLEQSLHITSSCFPISK